MEYSKKFDNILVKPEYKEYKDVWMMIRHQPYLVQFPIIDKPYNELREFANNKIHYRLEHPSPQRRELNVNINTKTNMKRIDSIRKHSKRRI